MTGSNLAAIVIPIVVMFGLAVWIVVVFHADSHPFWGNRAEAAPNETPARPSRKVPASSPHPTTLPPVRGWAASGRRG
jgi:hypothetical protein